MKPQIEMGLTIMTVHFKPWKGRVGNVAVMIEDDTDWHEQFDGFIEDLRNQKRHRQRTITSVTFSYNTKP